MLEFRVLGPLEVLRDGRPLPPVAPKQRALLVALLLRAGTVVPKERLIDDLWGENVPATVVNSLENAVSQLRKTIGQDVLLTRSAGYALAVDPEQVDLRRLERLRARAREAAPGERAARLREAVALFRGPPLQGSVLGPFAEREARRLEELELELRQELIAAELDVGRHADVLAELERLIREHPYREGLRALLLLALYRSGRQADALAAYHDARRTLVDELGTEPGDELRELQRAVLRQDPALRAPTRIESRAAARGSARPTRKTVSVLACTLAGWSELAARLDPEAQRPVLDRYASVVGATVERYGGAVDVVVEDAVTAVFGAPVAREDDAARAVHAAVALRTELEDLHEALAPRLAVETGEVLVEPAAGQVATGAAVSLAQSLARVAPPGEILLGGSTEWLLRDAATTEPAEQEIAGREGVVRVLALEPDAGRALRLDSPLVGREHELAQLDAALDQAIAKRAAWLVTVVGAPGVGKSRLVREFLEGVRDRATVLHGRCLAYGDGGPFGPIRDVLGDAIEHESAAAVFRAARTELEALARERPLVVSFDDVHWAEPAFLDLVENLVDLARRVPILVVCAARPELLERRASWAGGLPRSSSITVDPLAHDESERLVDNLLGESDLPDLVVQHIVRSADGYPLFLEELLAMLVDQAVLRRVRGRWTTSELPALAVPPTIQALIAARVDRLPDGERFVLELGSVQGTRFERAAVADVGRDDLAGDLDAHLESLVARELIRREPDAADAFSFRHDLVRDAAYESIPKRARAKLHERFADWIERGAGDRDRQEVAAFHLERAKRLRRELGEGEPQLTAG